MASVNSPGAPDPMEHAGTAERQPEGGSAEGRADQDGRPDEAVVVVDPGRYPQSRHPDIVHGADAEPDHDAAEQDLAGAPAARHGDGEGQAGDDHRDHERERRQGRIVAQKEARPERQHGDEMGRPDPAARDHGGGAQPNEAGPPARQDGTLEQV